MGQYDENNESPLYERHYTDQVRDDERTMKQEQPKKKHGWIWVLSGVGAALLTAATVMGAAIGASRIYKGRSSNELPTIVEEQPGSSEISKEKPSEPAKNEPAKEPQDDGKAVLTVSDTIKTSDDKLSVTVLDVSDIVEAVMPTVVAITDTLEYKSIQNSNPYNYFFGQGKGSSYEGVASGSGVIISATEKELFIVTNNHVVDNKSSASTGYSVSSKGLTITFSDDSTASATVKGTDPDNDLAVLSVNIEDLSEETLKTIRIAVIGSSDDLKVGDGVIAIGNAGGYGQSVTTGIISAKNRKVTIDGVTFTLLQTDAAINPGNSGGGLFNAKGELIGINNSKTVSTDIEGMGFAIPISSVKGMLTQLIEKGEAQRAYIGVYSVEITPDVAKEYNLPVSSGVYLYNSAKYSAIVKGSPAEKAGLQNKDIITAVNGVKIGASGSLSTLIGEYKPGDTVQLTVIRDGNEIAINVTLGAYSK